MTQKEKQDQFTKDAEEFLKKYKDTFEKNPTFIMMFELDNLMFVTASISTSDWKRMLANFLLQHPEFLEATEEVVIHPLVTGAKGDE